MTQGLVTVVRKTTWVGGNSGISHSRKTLVPHPRNWRGRGLTRVSGPGLPGVGTKKETQARARRHPDLLPSYPPPSVLLILVRTHSPSGH